MGTEGPENKLSENSSGSLSQIWEELKGTTELGELKAPVSCLLEFLLFLFDNS